MLHLGLRLKQIIEEEGYSKRSFADVVGTSPQNLSKWFTKEDLGTEILKQCSAKLRRPLYHFVVSSLDEIKTKKSVDIDLYKIALANLLAEEFNKPSNQRDLKSIKMKAGQLTELMESII